MYSQWQESLLEESRKNERRKARREARIKRNERRLLKLQRKLHMQKAGEDAAKLMGSSRRSSTTMSDASAVSQNNPLLRRHSVDSTPMSSFSSAANNARRDGGEGARRRSERSHEEDSPGRLARNGARRAGAARGILSRLSRPKQASHGRDLDKLPGKLERGGGGVAAMKQSASVPNLSSLDADYSASVFAVDFNVHEEGDNESSSDRGNEEGIFL